MNTLRAAIVPGLIGGVLSVVASWFWMGFVFHSFQRKTPDTWRPEGGKSYLGSSLLHIFAAIGVASLLTVITRFQIAFFGAGMFPSIRFGLCLWGALSVPMILEEAIYIRLHPLVVVGQLLDWLSTLVLASAVTGWWLGR